MDNHKQYFADIYTLLDKLLKVLESEFGNQESYAKELYDDPLSHPLQNIAIKRLKEFLNKWQLYSHNEKLVVFYNTLNYVKPVFLSVRMVLHRIKNEYRNRPDDNTKHYLECAYQEQSSLYQTLDSIIQSLLKLEADMPYELKYQLVFMAPYLNITDSNPVSRLAELQKNLKNSIRPKL